MGKRGRTMISTRWPSTYERFQDKYIPEPNSGCWIWVGACSGSGYAWFWDSGKYFLAHRWSYEYHVEAIPEKLTIDHLCRVKTCVNPVHLEAVTQRENTLRGNTMAGANSRKTHCKHGHPFSISNTAYRSDGNRRCRYCGKLRKAAYRKRKSEVGR